MEDLRVEFWTERGTIYAVNGVSFDIAKGETLGIVGESGSGKSVTALALLGILDRAGRVVGGQDLGPQLVEPLRTPRAERQVVAEGGELPRHLGAQTGGGAGDQDRCRHAASLA